MIIKFWNKKGRAPGAPRGGGLSPPRACLALETFSAITDHVLKILLCYIDEISVFTQINYPGQIFERDEWV